MINDPSTRSRSQKALEEAHFSKTSPSETAKKSRRSVRKTRQLALVAIQAAPTGTISIFFSPTSPVHIYIHLNKKSNSISQIFNSPFSLGEVRSIVE